MASYKQQHRILINYNKVCPICKNIFYEKDMRIKYCSESCQTKGNKQIQKLNHKKWINTHQERISELNKRYYRNNRDKARAYQKEYYEKNKEKMKEVNRLAYEKRKNKNKK